jgi:ferredoxin
MVLQQDRVVLHFPANLVTEPIIYRLIKDFGVSVNIMKAEVVESEEGLMVLGIQGVSADLEAAKKYLKDQGVRLQDLKRDVHVISDRCTHCGACVGQCPTTALSMNQDFELAFNPEECIACGRCAVACTFNAIAVEFDG